MEKQEQEERDEDLSEQESEFLKSLRLDREWQSYPKELWELRRS